jgi:hypothetical protein
LLLKSSVSGCRDGFKRRLAPRRFKSTTDVLSRRLDPSTRPIGALSDTNHPTIVDVGSSGRYVHIQLT